MRNGAGQDINGKSKGSLLIEAVVLLGLVALLTPVLVSQITERNANTENETKANTFLLLQTETESYIKTHYAEIIDDTARPAPYYIPKGGQAVYTPRQIKNTFYDVFDRKFKVGIKRSSNDEVNAMIVEIDEEGDAKRANKVAELVGVSAGVYSDVDRDNAWGVGGLWAEPVSNYFGEYPIKSGTTVVTTAYNREKKPVFLSTLETDEDLNLTNASGVKYGLEADTITTSSLCINNAGGTGTTQCIDEWSFAGFNAVSLIAECRANYLEAKTLTGGKDNSTITWDGNSPSCKKAFEKEFNQNCLQISKGYKNAGSYAPSNLYAVTGTGKNMNTKEVACYFVKGTPATNAQSIEGCKSGASDSSIACRYTYETGGSMGKIATSCAKIATEYYPNSEKGAPSAFYTLVNGYVTSLKNPSLGKSTDRTYHVPCLFTGRREATPCEAVEACNSNDAALSDVGCQYAFKKSANSSCDVIESTCKAEGKSLPEGYYNTTFGAGGVYGGKTSVYCFKSCNTSSDCSGSMEGPNCNLTSKRCFKCSSDSACLAAGHNKCNTTTGACYTEMIYSLNEDVLTTTDAFDEVTVKTDGLFKIEVWGQAAAIKNSYCVRAGYCKGGYTYGIYKMPKDAKITFSNYGQGGFGPSDPWSSGYTGFQGYSAYVDGTLVAVAGGAGGFGFGGFGEGAVGIEGNTSPFYAASKYAGNGGGGNDCGTQGSSSNTGKGGCRGSGGAGSRGGAAGNATNGGRGAYSCDNAGCGGGSGYGGGGGGGCGTYTGYGGGGGGGYLKTTSFGEVDYISGGGTTGGSLYSRARGKVTYLGDE